MGSINSNDVPNNLNLDLIKAWLKKGDHVKIAEELNTNRQTVSKVLGGERRTNASAIILCASKIALHRKKLHEATQENLKALAS